ncbi:MAG: rRNA maturation RNase YbeY [Cyclobacteriaceae bacterium]
MKEEKIHVFFEGLESFRIETILLESWIGTVCSNENHTLKNLSIIICTDEFLINMNRDHLDHDYYTDIITFDLSEEPTSIEGELYISLDRIRDNAKKLSVSESKELHRVIIHGVFHLIGYNDKTEQQQKIMRSKEDASLSLRSEI